MPKDNNPLVYSTDPDERARATEASRSPKSSGALVKDQTAIVSRTSKNRAGKTVTLISGLRHDPATYESLAKHLKRACGSGGTVKNGEIEIQGDHREKVAEELRAKGYNVKISGG